MTAAVDEFGVWLTGFLPNDYYENYRQYRWDLTLRRDYQRAAFEAGWIQPTWPREHGGRSLGLRDAMEVRLEAALRSAPKLPNIAGPNVAAPGIRQFGTPIGAFQGIKHALADNYVDLERAQSLTYAAAARLGDAATAPAAAWTAAALAKAAAGDAATGCARTAVQVHGALGQTWEHDVHLYVRHAWQGATMLGDSRALYHQVGRRFAGGAA